MAIETLIPSDLQRLLIEHGYALPKYGADGSWGDETRKACEAWFKTGTDLALPARETPLGDVGVVPSAWMPVCVMERVIVHWTAGSYVVSVTDREHYHIIVDGNGKLVRGDHSIEDNVVTADKDYAAHTLSCNRNSIGISAAAMAGAIQKPFSAGGYPLLKVQWDTLTAIAADLCQSYGIEVTPKTVLQHGEVEQNLGIKQRGKWDINVLPWAPQENAPELFRRNVSWLLEARRASG